MPGQELLRAAEANALTRGATSDTGWNYTGNQGGATGGKQRGKFGKKKNLGATLLIILALGIGGGALIGGGSHSLLMSAVQNKFVTQMDAQYGFGEKVTQQTLKWQLRHLGSSNSWTAKFNNTTEAFDKRLSASDVADVSNGSINYKGQSITSDNFSSVYDSDPFFRSAINDTTFNRAGNYYSEPANQSFYATGNTRNLFKEYEATGDDKTDTAKMKNTIDDDINGKITIDTKTSSERISDVEEEDENGNKVKLTDDQGNPLQKVDENPDIVNDTESNKLSQAEAEVRAESYISKISTNVSRVVNYSCTLLRLGSVVSILTAVNTKIQLVSGALGMTENFSKTMAGDGKNAAANSVLNTMVTAKETRVPNYLDAEVSGGVGEGVESKFGSADQGDFSINLGSEEVQNTSMVESDGMRAILTETAPNVTKSYNYSPYNTSNTLLKALNKFNVTNTTCNIAQGSVAAVSLAVSFIPGIGQAKVLASVGWSGIKSFFAPFFKKIGLAVIFNVTLSTALKFIIPALARSLTEDFTDRLIGYEGGQLFTAGMGESAAQLGRNASGLGIASEESMLAYNRLNNQVATQEAEVDRLRRSPFDTSSPNTFLGSIVHSLLPSVITSDSTHHLSGVTNLLDTTSKSLANFTGSVSAEGKNSNYFTTFGQCERLEAIGAVCNAYGTEAVTGDITLAEMSDSDQQKYFDLIDQSIEGCDENGDNCKVKDGSGLAKHIKYCAYRQSPFGITDVNIMQELENNSVVGGILGAIVGFLPLISDVFDILRSGINLVNELWGNGGKCVNSPNNDYWEEEGKYYAYYLTQRNSLDKLGAYEGSTEAASAYTQELLAEYNKDTSLVAQLSRYSGASKEDVQLALDAITYYAFLEDYDIESRIAMNNNTTKIKSGETVIAEIKSERTLFEDDSKVKSNETPVIANHQYIIYGDVRNRSYGVC